MSERRRRRAPRVGGGDVERDVHDEVAFHIESAAHDLETEGLDRTRARAEAERRFGSVRSVEDRLMRIGERRMRRRRLGGAVSDLGQDVRHSLRNLRRRPAFALMMIGILALGIAVSLAVLRVADAALVRALPFPHEEQVVRLFAGETIDERFPLSLPEYHDWARESTFAAAFASAGQTSVTVRREGADPQTTTLGMITGDVMAVSGLQPIIGRAFTQEEIERSEPVLMLSEATWRGQFAAAPSALGATLSVEGEPYTVIGVMPNETGVLFQLPSVRAWMPLREREWMVRTTHFLRTAVRLDPALTLEAAQERAEALERALIENGTTDHGVVMVGLREQVVAGSRPVLFVLVGAVVFVLLIVCANLANLFFAHALARDREFAVRASLGAGRTRLVRQVMTESLVLALAGGMTGLLLSPLLGSIVRAASGEAALLVPASGLDLRIIAGTALLSLVTGVLIGLWPALRAGGTGIRDSLKDGARTAGDRRSWRRRRILVGVEVAFTVVLLAGAALMIRTIAQLLGQDPGFEAEQVLAVDLAAPSTPNVVVVGSGTGDEHAATAAFWDELLTRIRQLPDVTAAGAITHLPLDGSDTNGSFAIVGREFPQDQMPHGKKRVATPGFFEAMGIPLLEGRAFNERDQPGTTQVVIVSESVARRYWPDGNAVGQRIGFSWGPGDEHEIVGVVGDILHDGLDAGAVGTLYRPHAQFVFPAMTLAIRTSGEPLSLTPAVRATIRALDPELPVGAVRAMTSVVSDSVGDRRTLTRLLAGFAALALILAGLGVYAVTSQAVHQRTREIGVRMAVGARRADVLRMVVREELGAVLIGLVLGVAGALAATRVLEASLFGVTPQDPVALVSAGLLIAAAAMFAMLPPARRAAMLDPARAIRHD